MSYRPIPWAATPSARPYKACTPGTASLHDLPFSLLVFAALAATCLVFARRFAGWGERGWAIYSGVTGALIVIGFFLSGQAFAQVPGLLQIGGLLQRLTIAVGWGWLTLLAIHLRSADNPAPVHVERHDS